ncbi:MAG TPA: SDR family oxidoreductase, partial [Thermomicrobiales bacterium]|nr:SDR family oxidoreductase [Thermomicrobiales bacterium]
AADLRADAAAAAAGEISRTGGRAVPYTVDVTDPAGVDTMLAFVQAEVGEPSVLVNNVGYVQPYDPSNSILTMSKGDWDHILATNLTSVYLCTRAVAPVLVANGGGSIINIASNIGRLLDIVTGSHYAAAKAGVLHFTRHVARELAGHGVRVNAVSPGVTATPRALAAIGPEVHEQIIARTPMQRLAEPAEIVGAALFLASSDATYITGATIDVAGGRVMV